MKIIVTVICLLIGTFTFSQRPILQKLWVGDANNYLKIDTAFVRAECWFTYQGRVLPTEIPFSQ